ncbi:MAG: hypothetical protein LUC83_05910 [Clostridiales bacterium]|nr:hypothetical protein [Clostridiales bacterium]
MADKDLFLETLREVAEIARVSGVVMEKEEIRRYFSGIDLSEEQEEMVYQYLRNVLNPADGNKENPENDDRENSAYGDSETEEGGMRGSISAEGDAATEATGAESQDMTASESLDGKDTAGSDASLDRLSESAYYRMYLNEVREKGSCSEEKMQELYDMLLEGEDVAGQIVDGWLLRIIRMAELYKECAVNMQDLIQEGNMALWLALGNMDEKMRPADVDRYLQSSVREAFEGYIREAAGISDQTQAMLAKAALLHEAQEFLASENGQAPSLRELGEYTHIPVDEIRNILALYEQAED